MAPLKVLLSMMDMISVVVMCSSPFIPKTGIKITLLGINECTIGSDTNMFGSTLMLSKLRRFGS